MDTPGTRTRILRPAHPPEQRPPALIGCGEHPAAADPAAGGGDATTAMTVVPLLDGDRVEGFEVRCGCGQRVIVECRYAGDEEAE